MVLWPIWKNAKQSEPCGYRFYNELLDFTKWVIQIGMTVQAHNV
jgi:hypothetical protein